VTATTREVIKGLASGAGFLVVFVALGAPVWLGAAIAGGIYLGLSLVLPKPKLFASPDVAPGLSVSERDEFLASCRTSLNLLARLSGQVPNLAFAQQVRDFGKTVHHLITYLESKPEAILLSCSVPRNLEHLAGMVSKYVALSSYQQAGQTAEEALKKVESVFETASASFTQMYQQLLDNDVAALESSAQTLAILMGVDVEQQRQRTVSPVSSSEIDRQAVPPRLPQKEN
jgi:hypothetical protein